MDAAAVATPPPAGTATVAAAPVTARSAVAVTGRVQFRPAEPVGWVPGRPNAPPLPIRLRPGAVFRPHR
nr:hypothetical protein KPHV_12130 [Kitasatospora purpeofusca]